MNTLIDRLKEEINKSSDSEFGKWKQKFAEELLKLAETPSELISIEGMYGHTLIERRYVSRVLLDGKSHPDGSVRISITGAMNAYIDCKDAAQAQKASKQLAEKLGAK